MIDPKRFIHTARDAWRWAPALPADVAEIVDLVISNYHQDAQNLWQVNAAEAARNLMHAIVNQMYDPKTELVSVARLQVTGKIIAFTWATRNHRMVWSTEEMINGQMASIDLAQGARTRTALVFQTLRIWEKWAEICELKLITTASIRLDWEPLMYLINLAGYNVRGSQAWRRLIMKTINIDLPINPSTVVAHSTYTPADGYYYQDNQPVIVATGAEPTMEIYKGSK
jgi:hypothetical protein